MDSYQIGISILLQSNVAQQLQMISTRMLGLHTNVRQINQQFGRMAQLIGGVGAAFAGVGIVKGMVSIVEHGAKINHELELMKNQSFEVKEIQQSMAAAMQISASVQQTTVAENLKHIRELRYAFGETPDAMKYLEIVSKANVVANSYAEKFGISGMKDQVFDLVKGEEMKGLTYNPEDFTRMMDVWVKAMVASGGKVTAANFLGTMKYARTAGLGWNETFMGQFLPRLMQEYSTGGSGGAGGPGNALMSAYSAVVRGQLSKRAATEWARMGLGDVEHIAGSSQSILRNVPNTELFMANPYNWVQDVLMPMLSKHGVTGENAVTQELSQMFSNRTAADIITKMALQGRFMEGANSPFEKDAKLARMAQGIMPAYAELSKGDWQTNMVAFHKQFENLLELLGAPIVMKATDVLRAINNSMSSLAQFAGAHPARIRLAMEAAAAIGGGLVVGGIVAVLAAIGSVVSVPAVAWGAAAGAIAALGALNWQTLADAINSTVGAINKFIATITGIPAAIGHIFGGGAEAPAPGGGGATMPLPSLGGKKSSYNAIPPASGASGGYQHASIIMDGRKVGELVTARIADRATWPTEGSRYFDATWHAPASDVKFA